MSIKTTNTMITISARDFRESQSKYLKQALDGRDIILYTRDYGSFRIVPLTESDRVYSDRELDAMIDEALTDYKEGRTKSYSIKELKAKAGMTE